MAMVMSHVAYTTNTLDYGNLVPFLNIFGLQFQFKNVLVFCRESRGVYAWEMLEKLKEKNHRWFFTDFLFLERWTLSRVKRKLENTNHSFIFTHFICCNIIRKFKRAKWKKQNRTERSTTHCWAHTLTQSMQPAMQHWIVKISKITIFISSQLMSLFFLANLLNTIILACNENNTLNSN